MRALATLAMRGPNAASASIALFAVLGLIFAPLMLVSGGLVALVALRHGASRSARVLATAAAMSAVASYLMLGHWVPALLVPVTWLPTWLAALALRHTQQQGVALSVNALMVAGYALLTRALIPDVSAFWRQWLEMLGAAVQGAGGRFLSAEEIAMFAGVMQEASLVTLSAILAAMLLLGRWWQAILYNPGGFATEFQQLRLPRQVSAIAAVVALATLVQIANRSTGLASDLVIVVMVLFALQGLAVVHHRVATRGLKAGWLVGLYVLLIFKAHIVGTVLATTGIADMVVDFRRQRPRQE